MVATNNNGYNKTHYQAQSGKHASHYERNHGHKGYSEGERDAVRQSHYTEHKIKHNEGCGSGNHHNSMGFTSQVQRDATD